MRDSSLFILTVVKLVELLFLIMVTILMTIETFTFAAEHQKFRISPTSVCYDFNRFTKPNLSGVDRNDYSCFDSALSWLLVCCGIAWIHTLHNNMLTNIRLFLFWKKKVWLCWKPINFLICKFGYPDQPSKGCQFFCRDKCFEP